MTRDAPAPAPDAPALLAAAARRLQALVKKHRRGQTLSPADLAQLGAAPPAAAGPGRVHDSIAAAAAALGVGPELLRKAKKAGAPGFSGSRVHLDLTLPWLVQHLWREQKTAAGLTREQRLLEIKIARAQFAFDCDQNKFRPAAEVESGLAELIASFTRTLDAIVPALAADVVGCGPIAEAEKRIRAAHEQVKRALHSAPL